MEQPTIAEIERLIAALQSYRQADDDGVMCIVSREACERAVAALRLGLQDRRALEWLDRDDIEIECLGDEGGTPFVRVVDAQSGVSIAEAPTAREAIYRAMQ